jgi:uncharacterized protein
MKLLLSNQLLSNQSYLIYLAAVMIISGIIKEYRFFAGLYTFLISKIRSKRALLILISALSGILPIPGRVAVSAGILNTIASDEKKSKSKFGLIDYLSTHHYYLWSPLEKTVIIPMAVLNLTYIQFLKYSFPLLIISIGYTCWYIFTRINEKEIIIDKSMHEKSGHIKFLSNIFPIITGILLLILGFSPPLIFGALALYYVILSSAWRDYKKIFGYINFKLMLFLAIVIITGNFAKEYYKEIESFLSNIQLDIHTPGGIILIGFLAFFSAFVLGSSSKFAGLMALLTAIYGMEYFTFFLALEFSGYLLSPVHKCVAIGKMYFGTPWRSYAGVISGWCAIMIAYGAIYTMVI